MRPSARKDRGIEEALRAANSVFERNRRPIAEEAFYIAAALVMSAVFYVLR